MKKDILPVGPLMKEHRVIEHMVEVLKNKLVKFRENKMADPGFINSAVDFFSVYADECHHGKEERILFARLSEKNLSNIHKKIMDHLIEDHRFGRKAVNELRLATARFGEGEADALGIILGRMKDLIDLYPPHIKMEDEEFFLPCMKYFDDSERRQMLEDFCEFDGNMIQTMYKSMVQRLEKNNNRAHKPATGTTQ